MARKPARLGYQDVQRVVRAYQCVGVSVRVVYLPDGRTVFEPVNVKDSVGADVGGEVMEAAV